MTLLPTQILAGVDTPLVNKAIDLCRAHLNCMRFVLFGFVIAGKIPELKDRDTEAHAVAAILHDLGWDTKGEFVTPDKRFEVDGADAAREFLRKEATDWDKHRLKLVWDAIELHRSMSIVVHKEPEVIAPFYGISADFSGPEKTRAGILKWEEYNPTVKEYPRLGAQEGIQEIMCHLCRTKPETTYDNFVGQFGEKYVEGYSLQGKQVIDFMESNNLG